MRDLLRPSCGGHQAVIHDACLPPVMMRLSLFASIEAAASAGRSDQLLPSRSTKLSHVRLLRRSTQGNTAPSSISFHLSFRTERCGRLREHCSDPRPDEVDMLTEVPDSLAAPDLRDDG
jgi:hypothetical protein